MNRYIPHYDNHEIYANAARQQKDPDIKLLLDKAAATIKTLRRHYVGTVNMLAELNNLIVESEDDGGWLEHDDLADYLPRLRAAIEACDDVNHEFHSPYVEWQHLAMMGNKEKMG